MEKEEMILDYVTRQRIKEAKMKAMFSDETYILWLNKFSEKHSKFTDDEWYYYSQELTEKDKNNVANLYLLFEIIDKYASSNYIYPIIDNWGWFYSIKHGDTYYNIGFSNLQGTVFYCDRINAIDNAINFADILSNKVLPRTLLIEERIKLLSQNINKLLDEGVPIEAILDIVNDIQESRTNPKKLAKKRTIK